MKLNETLAELSDDHEFLGEWFYFFTVMGKPSATEPWGFQLDGHHAIINYFVRGDQVVIETEGHGVRDDGRWIKTSLVRTDTGAGACEVMLVSDVTTDL